MLVYGNFEILILLFFVYSFAGWVFESIGGIFVVKKFVNRGFLIGPYCPVYGTGVVLISVLLKQYTSDLVVFFVLAMVICGTLEYATSYFMEKLFNARWWDYSAKKFNINGRVCLDNLFLFCIAAVGIMYGTNPILERLFMNIPESIRHYIAWGLAVAFTIDTIFSFKIISKFKNEVIREAKDNTEEMSGMVMDKAEDIIMTAGTKTIELSRDIKYMGLKFQRKVKYTGKKFTSEGNKFIHELSNKANAQRRKFANRIMQSKKNVTDKLMQGKKDVTDRLVQGRRDVTDRINTVIEKFRIKSVLNKRLIDAFPQLQINIKKIIKSEEKKK